MKIPRLAAMPARRGEGEGRLLVIIALILLVGVIGLLAVCRWRVSNTAPLAGGEVAAPAVSTAESGTASVTAEDSNRAPAEAAGVAEKPFEVADPSANPAAPELPRLAEPIAQRNPTEVIRQQLQALGAVADADAGAATPGGGNAAPSANNQRTASGAVEIPEAAEMAPARVWWSAFPGELRATLPANWLTELEAGLWQPVGEPRLLVQGARRQRWELSLGNAAGETRRLWLDYELNEAGPAPGWRLSALRAGSRAGETGGAGELPADALDVAGGFLDALRSLDIEAARRLAQPGAVSNAQLAALCILLEDRLFEVQPESLRLSFDRPGVQAFSATLVPVAGADRAVKPTQLGFILHSQAAGGEVQPRGAEGGVAVAEGGVAVAEAEVAVAEGWRVVELDFDEALARHAAHTGAEDAYYTPLVESPEGGQSLALYFAFDEAELNPRAVAQLDIVSRLLAEDPQRKLVISGHTDARGSEDYNEGLGLQRARDVRDFLVRHGIPESQVELRSFGASRPRAENQFAGGADNPDGRQANRRAEIYLDF